MIATTTGKADRRRVGRKEEAEDKVDTYDGSSEQEVSAQHRSS